MRFDAHIHAGKGLNFTGNVSDCKSDFYKSLANAGIDGGFVLSFDPLKYPDISPEKRIQYVIDICSENDNLFPFYFINPLEETALRQVDLAIASGVSGFKMICSTYNVSNTKCMDVLSKIAANNKPVLFHSGILWDGRNSANNNRPGNFEALIEIPRLKFCLAHISWPWVDECIAVFGKFSNAYSKRSDNCEMFIDITPGTPRSYRREALTRLLDWSEYDLRYNIMFGTDSNCEQYNVPWALEWQKRDDEIYSSLITKDYDDFINHVYYMNALRFVGKSNEEPVKRIPVSGN